MGTYVFFVYFSVMEEFVGPRRNDHPLGLLIVVAICSLCFFPPRGRQPTFISKMADKSKCGREREGHAHDRPCFPFPARIRTRRS